MWGCSSGVKDETMKLVYWPLKGIPTWAQKKPVFKTWFVQQYNQQKKGGNKSTETIVCWEVEFLFHWYVLKYTKHWHLPIQRQQKTEKDNKKQEVIPEHTNIADYKSVVL